MTPIARTSAYLSSNSVSHLQSWLRSEKTRRNIFCKVDRHGSLCKRPLQNATVSIIIKQRAKDAKLLADKIKRLSGHSLHVGAAQDMMKSGIDLLPIMRAGGWRSKDAVSRYVKNVDIRSIFKSSSQTK
jgi:integrase